MAGIIQGIIQPFVNEFVQYLELRGRLRWRRG
jgi:hypothetical protein